MKTLAELEQKIYKVQIDYLDISRALYEIKERGLFFEAGYKTFDAYLEGRWELSSAYLKNIMKAASVESDVRTYAISAPTVTQALFMKSLTTPQRQELAKKVKDFSKTPITTIKALVAKAQNKTPQRRKIEPDFLWGEQFIFSANQVAGWAKDLRLRPASTDANAVGNVLRAAQLAQIELKKVMQYLESKCEKS